MQGEEFETEVRNVARALWDAKIGDGNSINIEGMERDCIFHLEDITHYIECTVSRRLDKVKKDVRKMVSYRAQKLKQGTTVKLWFITLEEPTSDQSSHCNQHGVISISLREFQRKIFDASQYLRLRLNYQFGSATNPQNQSTDLSNVYYQPVGIRNLSSNLLEKNLTILTHLNEGKEVLLVGDYGMGKSLNVYQFFLELRKNYFKNETKSLVPVVLNLREHWGQEDPYEALTRHCRNIGYRKDHELIRAFNAGRLVVFLDGFDEVGSMPWSRVNSEASQIRNLRRSAVKLIANFVSKCRGKSGVLVAGRRHFFDTKKEMLSSLGLRSNCKVYALDAFTDEEATDFIRNIGFNYSLPDWFPKRPLLLASLAAKGILESISNVNGDFEPSAAWDNLVNLTCQREAEIHKQLEATGIRIILEDLASLTRETNNNLGPITEDNIAEAFRRHVGAYPDETARPLLQRLPGLSLRDLHDGTRNFLDDQMLDVLRAGEVSNFLVNPYKDPNAKNWQNGLGELGTRVVLEKNSSIPNEKVLSLAIVAAKEALNTFASPTLAIDCILVAQQIANPDSKLDLNGLCITGGACEVLDLENNASLSNCIFDSCIINHLILPGSKIEGITLQNCIISKVYGVSLQDSMPPWLEGCDVSEFDEVLTNAKIMTDNKIQLPSKVLLTILRKLYIQKGGGRKENAFYRGLDTKSQELVSPILNILKSEGFAFKGTRQKSTVWHPISGKKRMVLDIIENKGKNKIDLCQKVQNLA